ncbi:MAG: OmpA family protein [Myxococcales bacterium]|nr:OmpA family protein [Myxococcales bacterium]
MSAASGSSTTERSTSGSTATRSPRSTCRLAALAEVIQASPGLGVVRVEVHTDPRGSAEYNRLLSQRRAEAIRAALIERGVDGGRLRAIGFGADRPIVCNECDSWALSRRVEFWRDR